MNTGRQEVVTGGSPVCQGATDSTLVPPLKRDDTPQTLCSELDGAVLLAAQQWRERLVVLGFETGGRWSSETQSFLRPVALQNARHEQHPLRTSARLALLLRWRNIFAQQRLGTGALSAGPHPSPLSSSGRDQPGMLEMRSTSPSDLSGFPRRTLQHSPFFKVHRCLIKCVEGELSGSADVKRAVYRINILGRSQAYCALPTVQHPKQDTRFKQWKNEWLLISGSACSCNSHSGFCVPQSLCTTTARETDMAQGLSVSAGHMPAFLGVREGRDRP